MARLTPGATIGQALHARRVAMTQARVDAQVDTRRATRAARPRSAMAGGPSGGPGSGPAGARAFYAGAQVNRLTADWVMDPITSALREMQAELPRLRARSRDLARNTPAVKRWLKLSETNVIGPQGVGLQAQNRRADGTLDRGVNAAIETAWREFSTRRHASLDGRLSLHAIARLLVRLRRMDGEALVRIRRGVGTHGLALQVLDADQLDHGFNRAAGAGVHEVRLGVEVTADLAPVAYHLWTAHPGDGAERVRVRVPAEDIIHYYRVLRPGQVRGIPETHAVLLPTKMLDGAEEAHLVATRVGSSQMGFFIPPATDVDDPSDDDELPDGERPSAPPPLEMEAEPGMMRQLEAGWDVKQFNPAYPAAGFSDFVKTGQRKTAIGLDMTYAFLYGDLAEVNFSSGRLGKADERDEWRTEQTDVVEAFYDRVYDEWLKLASLAGALRLPTSDASRYGARRWQPRGFPQVDPLKEGEADARDIGMGLRSFRHVASERGEDWEENLRGLAEEYALARELGVPLHLTLPSAAGAPARPAAESATGSADPTDPDDAPPPPTAGDSRE